MTKKKKPHELLKVGRPSSYTQDKCEIVIALGREGYSPVQICSVFDISRQTLDNWAEAHPEFLDALTRAKVHAQAYWEELGNDGATGRLKAFNSLAWKTIVQARFRDDYTERKSVEHSGPGGTPIQANVAFSFIKADPKEEL